jgi:hypothetical protein
VLRTLTLIPLAEDVRTAIELSGEMRRPLAVPVAA